MEPPPKRVKLNETKEKNETALLTKPILEEKKKFDIQRDVLGIEGLIYIKEFITKEEERKLLEEI